MLGIRCPSGPTPVVIVAAHTGVTDGNAATQSSTYTPSSRIRASAGARPVAIARSSIAGLSASITTRTSFFPGRDPASRSPQDPQPGVLLTLAPASGEQQPQQAASAIGPTGGATTDSTASSTARLRRRPEPRRRRPVEPAADAGEERARGAIATAAHTTPPIQPGQAA